MPVAIIDPCAIGGTAIPPLTAAQANLEQIARAAVGAATTIGPIGDADPAHRARRSSGVSALYI
jgi:hypothetical protein